MHRTGCGIIGSRGKPVAAPHPQVIAVKAVPPALSVVIPCRNGERYFAHQLDALVAQKTSFVWELVVVDNGSTDRSAEVAMTYRDRIQLRVLSATERASQGYARNVGAQVARADTLVFIDADDEIEPGFLTSMFTMLQDHELVTSPASFDSVNPEWNREAHLVAESSSGSFAPRALGSAVGVTRRALEGVGGWPEDVPCEDMALSFRLQQCGVSVAFLPSPMVRYRVRSSLRGLFKQTRAWGYKEAMLHRDFGGLFVHDRSASLAVSEWLGTLRAVLTARSRADLAQCAVRLGYCVGRLHGSLRYRVFYL